MLFCLLNIILAVLQQSGENHAAEIPRMNCHTDSCYGAFNIFSNLDKQALFIKKNCFCDPECIKFGDCCKDKLQIDLQPSHILQCKKPFWLVQDQTIYMKSKCSDNWNFPETREHCEVDVDPIKDPFSHVPVTSFKTGLTYKNIFCATCNHEYPEFMQFWKITVACPFRYRDYNFQSISEIKQLSRYNAQTGHWELSAQKSDTREYLLLRCSNAIEPLPDMLKIIRPCKPSISTCATDWKDKQVSEMCKQHTAYRYVYNDKSNKKVYKNVFCAICNYEPVDKIECEEHIFPTDNTINDSTKDSFPINLFLRSTISKRDTDDIQENSCVKGSMINPFTKQCVNVQINCGRFGKNKESKCEDLG